MRPACRMLGVGAHGDVAEDVEHLRRDKAALGGDRVLYLSFQDRVVVQVYSGECVRVHFPPSFVVVRGVSHHPTGFGGECNLLFPVCDVFEVRRGAGVVLGVTRGEGLGFCGCRRSGGRSRAAFRRGEGMP